MLIFKSTGILVLDSGAPAMCWDSCHEIVQRVGL